MFAFAMPPFYEHVLKRTPVLPENETILLINQMRIQSDPAKTRAKNRLVEGHLRLVLSIALHRMRSSASWLPFDDRMQAGLMGLNSAIGRFDPNRGVPFGAYAALTIRGYIMVAESREKAYERGYRIELSEVLSLLAINKFCARFATRHGRMPDVEEIHAFSSKAQQRYLQRLTLKNIAELVVCITGDAGAISLDAPVSKKRTKTLHDLIGDDSRSPDACVGNTRQFVAHVLQTAHRLIDFLPTREAAIFRLRCGFGEPHTLTFKEIGARFNRSGETMRLCIEKAELLFKDAGIIFTVEIIQALIEFQRALDSDLNMLETSPLRGVPELLEQCKKRSARLIGHHSGNATTRLPSLSFKRLRASFFRMAHLEQALR